MFICDEEVEHAFAAAEPPAHDDWIHQYLERPDKTYVRQIKTKMVDDLPDGDVLIRVNYSSLNYKDALSATGNKGVTRSYPHTPGIDAAGTVADSRVDAFEKGDPVLVTGYDLGMNTSGGFGQYVRVPAGWCRCRGAFP